MNPASTYIILGTPHSQRCELVYDLIDGSSHEGKSSMILLPENEKKDIWEEILKDLKSTKVETYQDPSNIDLVDFIQEDRVFYITNPHGDLADEIEKAQQWLTKQNLQLTRILGTINAKLAFKTDEQLWPYYEALAHFSDYILVMNSKGVDNTWMQKFLKRFKEHDYPCFVEKVKKGQVNNPMLVLDSLERRLTQVFDKFDPLDEMNFNKEELPEDPFDIDVKPDPYLERNEEGDRIRPLPDITPFID